MRNNNFDFLRIFFALLVIITHSIELSGANLEDPLFVFSKGAVTCASLGVKGFFVISGYLIFGSLVRSGSLKSYLWKRFLRLFPGLSVVLIFSTILMFFVYEGNDSYWSESSVWTYFSRNITLYFPQYSIKGVFEGNPYPSAINGSLWTIAYEFSLYIALMFLTLFRSDRTSRAILVAITIATVLGSLFYSNTLQQYSPLLNLGLLVELSGYFLVGSVLASFNIESSRLKKSRIIILFSFIFTVLAIFYGNFSYIKYTFFPLTIILFGLNSNNPINKIDKTLGDISYGLYIYAFPIQQTLVWALGWDFWNLLIYSSILSALIAYVSWHLVEKRALEYKKLLD